MKLILRLIGLKMSILRVDAAIINPKTVKPNGWAKAGLEKETVIDQSMDRLALRMAESGNEEALQIREEVKKLEQEISEEERKLKRLTTNDYITNTGLNSENNIPKAT